MSKDTAYAPIPLIYKSHGLIARNVPDQPPGESYYLDYLNMLERAEEGVSSRYGTTTINRSPNNTVNGQNFFFTSPVITLAKLVYGNQPSRYAALADGTLHRRDSNLQGSYVPIYSGLSGNPLQTVIASCSQTSQAYLFLYDSAVSIKDSGVLGSAPVLTGLDLPPFTTNQQPYSPLLTLIDNFNSGNSYIAAGWADAPTFTTITTLSAATSQQITDFPEFFGITNSSGGTPSGPFSPVFGPYGNVVRALLNLEEGQSGTDTVTSAAFSGFPSVPIGLTDTVTLTIQLASFVDFSQSITPPPPDQWLSGTGTVQYQYSLDGGVSWTTFYTYTQSEPVEQTLTPQTITVAISGLTNISTLQLQFVANIVGVRIDPGAALVSAGAGGQVNSIMATIDNTAATDPFDGCVDGMLAVLGSSNPSPVAIASIQSASLVAEVYTQLLVTTQTPHGLTAGSLSAVYGSTNDLLDGYYVVQAAPSTTTYLVNFYSATALSATGGLSYGGLARPSTCVIANHQSTPYPSQFSGWGFYEQVPLAQSTFPVGAWAGMVAQNTTSASPATFGKTVALDLSYNNQVTDDDLIVITLFVSDPAAIGNIRLQFDIRGSDYTSSYYYKDLSPAYYQQGVENLTDAYTTTEQQIFADTLGLVTGQPPNSTTAQLQPGNISTGGGAWQTIYLRRGDFVAVGTAGQPGLDWSAITGWQLVVTTTTVGGSTVAINGLYLQWGYGPSSFGGVGYDYRQTYYCATTGTESNPSAEMQYNSQFGWLSSLAKPFYLRQAAQVTGYYSPDPQDTHVRIYRRGGIYNDNWRQIDQIPNLTASSVGSSPFIYKDVIADQFIAQAQLLVLDNDPPVTSSLRSPIQTALTSTPTSPGSSIYSLFTPQLLTVALATAVFVPNQIVDIGYASNLEQVVVIVGGVGQFTAVLRLQHNQGEPVNVYAVPRQPCNLAALAYQQTWLAGDPNNPHYLYFSKVGLPENFPPQNYIPVGSPDYPIVIVVNWRGTLFVATTQTWWLIVGGAQPYAQPTGSIHGAVASQGWTQNESGVTYRAADGWRVFSGADGAYLTLPVEFLFRQTPLTPVPLTDPTQAAADVFAFYNNQCFGSYVSLDSGQRYRLIWDFNYQRFRYDDIAATAMLWERDTNVLLAGVPAPAVFPGLYCIVNAWTQNQDYDDGGWQGTPSTLVEQPIALAIQSPYYDLGKPHFPKQWNVLETDCNTANQTLNTLLEFDTEPPVQLTLATANTGNQRDKVQLQITDGVAAADGFQAYSASIRHTMQVTSAPTLYQENIYAAILADYRSSFDTYWLAFDDDESKIVRQAYFDYTSTVPITVNLYVDGNMLNPYFTFVLVPQPNRLTVRVLFPAWKPRLWRMIGACDGDYQFWSATQVEVKPVHEGSSFRRYEVRQ